MRAITTILFLSIISFSAFSQPVRQNTPDEYIARYKDLAISEMIRTGVPASIKLAQGILESGNGNSQLSRESNNHFGIKCRRDWTGPRTYHDDDEKGECFRVYGKVEDSYHDHSEFLRAGQRYAFLFQLEPTDYRGWANGLRAAGYATNPNYARLLINIIERHQLYQYDLIGIGQAPVVADVTKIPEDFSLYGIPATRAREGDTYESIARRYDMMPWQVRKYNDLERRGNPEAGMIIFLKPKNNRAQHEVHTVGKGETMLEIAQKYGIKLSPLYRRNRLKNGDEVAAGEKIYFNKRQNEAPKVVDAATKAAEKPREVKPTQPATPAPVTPPATPPVQAQQTPAPSSQPKKEEPKPQQPVAQQPVPPTTTPVAPTPETPVNQQGSGSVGVGMMPTTNTNAEFHTVITGETMFAISRKYNITVEQIKEWNNLPDNNIRVGQSLRVKAGNNTAPQQVQPNQVQQITHTVTQGETLFSIARKYETTVELIMKLNNLEEPTIKIGDKLIVKN